MKTPKTCSTDRFTQLSLMRVIACVGIIVLLVLTTAGLPPFGDPDNPANNEVSGRYIEKGLEETGAVNIVDRKSVV